MKEGIRKEYKKQYDASTKKIDIVDVPEFNFIMIDGIGNPEVEEFHLKSKALRIMSAEIREYFKQEKNLVYLISPLEGLWDTYDNSKFDVTRKKMIKFTLMMAQPKLLDPNTFEIIKQKAANKKDNPYIVDIYLKRTTCSSSTRLRVVTCLRNSSHLYRRDSRTASRTVFSVVSQ